MLDRQTVNFDNLMGWMMRNDVKLKTGKILLSAALTVISTNVIAYDTDDAKEKCREPKIQEFNLPEYKVPKNEEVPPEAEFSFIVSGWSDPKKIKVTGKNKPIPFVVESSETFHKVKGKLPAEFNGQYVRLNARIPAILGCYSNQGWLLKVAAGTTSAPATSAPAEATTPAKSGNAPAAAEPVKPEVKTSVEQSANKSAATDQKVAEPVIKPAPANEQKTETPEALPVEKSPETNPANDKKSEITVNMPTAAETLD